MKLAKYFFILLMITSGCGGDNPEVSSDNFDRSKMLINWTDNIIIPAYDNYVLTLENLSASNDQFIASPSLTSLENVREAWFQAYLAWQSVSMFEIGKAEELSLRNYTNVYPTNTTDMLASIISNSSDLTLVNKQDEQGFPAIEYLLFGLRDTAEGIVDTFNGVDGMQYQSYLSQLVDRLVLMGTEVRNDWKNGYRETFIENTGSDATSSVNKMVNDYLFYYERSLRAGKIGIPAGVFSATSLADRVEGYYSGKSKTLFFASLNAAQDFFNGKHFGSQESGESLSTYLNYLNYLKEGEDLSTLINNQFEQIKQTANNLQENFATQVSTNNTAMLATYDQLQFNVIYMKVDMMQALNIKVDFVDADGD